MQTKRRSCFKCKYETETAGGAKCPRCGSSRFYSETNIRVRGGLLIACGGFLIALMWTISAWMYNVIFQAEAAGGGGGGARFTGDAGDLAMIAGVFGFVFLFGLVAVIAGLWQLILGRRNIVLVWVIVALGVVFLVGGQAFYFLAPR